MMNKLFAGLMAIVMLASCTKDDITSTGSGGGVSTTTVAAVNNTVATGNWRITYFYDSDHEETAHFSGYEFVFSSNGTLTATRNSTTVAGTWRAGNDDSRVKLYITFTSPADFAELSEDWRVLERTDTKIRLQHISGGNGGTDYLTFERN